MITTKPIRLRWDNKLFTIIRTVRTNNPDVAEDFREYYEADISIANQSEPELWYICNEIKDAVYRDLEPVTES